VYDLAGPLPLDAVAERLVRAQEWLPDPTAPRVVAGQQQPAPAVEAAVAAGVAQLPSSPGAQPKVCESANTV
jgi:hypothetical protein